MNSYKNIYFIGIGGIGMSAIARYYKFKGCDVSGYDKTELGEKDYSSIWSLMMMGNSMVGALSFSSIGLFYDVGGSYVGAFLMAICLYGAAVLIGAFALNKSKQLRKTQI